MEEEKQVNALVHRTNSELSTTPGIALTRTSNTLEIMGRSVQRLHDGAVMLIDLVPGTPITPADEMEMMARLQAHMRQEAIVYRTILGKRVQMPTPISEVIRMGKSMGKTRESMWQSIDAWTSKKRYAEFQPIEVLECTDIEDKVYDYDWYLAQAEVRDSWGNVTYDHTRRAGIERTVVDGQPLFRPHDGKPVLKRYGFERMAPEPYAEPQKIEATHLPEEIRAMIADIKQAEDNG